MTYFQHLISSIDLHAILPRKDLILLDASIPPVGNMAAPKHSWPEVRLPNARRFDLNQHFSDLSSAFPHTMPCALHFQHAAQSLGINQNSQVVIYDDLGMFSAARSWYMFKAMGHKNVAVLDGGLPHWMQLKKPVEVAQLGQVQLETKTKKTISVGNFVANEQPGYFCDWQAVQKQSRSQVELIIDARGSRRFDGVEPEPRAGVRSGHMPNAKNLPYTELLNKGMFKSPVELKSLFNMLNADEKGMIMSCGSGVTACILALAADICGYKNITVYDGSWSEWGALPHTEVVTSSGK